LESITKFYGSRQVVSDISFSAHAGRVTALLGPNGSGKTTCLKVGLGLISGGGQATFAGSLLTELERPWNHIGVVVDGGSAHPRRSATVHLKMVAAACQVPSSRVQECLAMVGLSEVSNRGPKTYSLGMKQRLGLATALLGRPQFLILDEPANGLDPHGVIWLWNVLRSLADDGAAILLSSHLLAQVQLLADGVIVMAQGAVLKQEPLTKLLATANPGLEFTVPPSIMLACGSTLVLAGTNGRSQRWASFFFPE
jgi:ABC-2 type transport system ATP-binding protein